MTAPAVSAAEAIHGAGAVFVAVLPEGASVRQASQLL